MTRGLGCTRKHLQEHEKHVVYLAGYQLGVLAVNHGCMS